MCALARGDPRVSINSTSAMSRYHTTARTSRGWTQQATAAATRGRTLSQTGLADELVKEIVYDGRLRTVAGTWRPSGRSRRALDVLVSCRSGGAWPAIPAPRAGFEPAAYSLGGSRSIRLSYRGRVGDYGSPMPDRASGVPPPARPA